MVRTQMLIHRIENAAIGGEACDVELGAGRIRAIRRRAPASDRSKKPAACADGVLDAEGGALLPGLHDHHIHLFALAARLESLDCGPPAVSDLESLAAVLEQAEPRSGWIRGTGYHESIAGPLNRELLDRLRDDVPVRIQHRSGVAWCLNSRAVEELGLDHASEGLPTAAIERDARGRPTGRLFRADVWLGERIGRDSGPDLAPVGRMLTEAGITRVTDCSAANEAEAVRSLGRARATGALPQRLQLMGRLDLPESPDPDCVRGPHKIMLDEPALPAFGRLVDQIGRAHEDARNVAFHVVTRTELVFALAALEEAGARRGDRLEHASIAPPELIDRVARLGLTVVTQPHFIFERGDAYLKDVEPSEQPYLYRLNSWLDRGVRLAGGSDAPYGAPDPWAAMRAAMERRTRSGRSIGAEEALSPEAACALFAPSLDGTRDYDERRPPCPRVGDPADLCLLDLPWEKARLDLDRGRVRRTLLGGESIAP